MLVSSIAKKKQRRSIHSSRRNLPSTFDCSSISIISFLHFRALRRWETLKYEAGHMEQSRRHASHRSGAESSAANDPNESTVVKRRTSRSEDNPTRTPLTRVIPERIMEKTREKQTQRVQYRKRNDLKLAFSEFYLMLVLLQNYQTLNFTGFRKILKKHDKLFQTTRGEEWR